MGHDIGLLRDLAIVLAAAAAIALVMVRLRLPVVLGYLLAGIFIGPYAGLALVADTETIGTLAELGVILLMFSLGLDFRLRKIARLMPSAGMVTLIEVGLMLTLGYLAGQALGWSTLESVFTGAMVAISSTMVITTVFSEQKIKGPVADLVFGVLVFEDLIVVLMMTLLTAIAAGVGVSPELVGRKLAGLGAFVLVFLVVGVMLVPRAMRALIRQRRPEMFLVACVGLCFGTALLAAAAGFSVALGAFLAGSLVAESGASRRVGDATRALRDMFGAIFFVSVGMLVDPVELQRWWPAVLLLVGVVVGGKLIGVSAGALLAGYPVRQSLRSGFGMTQIGEFSYILVAIGLEAGAIGSQLYPVAVAVSVITAFSSPMLLRWSPSAADWVDRHLPKRLQTFVTLYGSWVDTLKRGRPVQGRGGETARIAWILLADTLLLAGLIAGVSIVLRPMAEWLTTVTGLERRTLGITALALSAVLGFPLVVAVVRAARKLGQALSEVALPRGAGGTDYGREPRRAFMLAAEIAIVLAVGAPLVAVTIPFVPRYAGPIFLGLILLSFGVAFWRSTRNLDGHIRATGLLIVEALSRQASGREPTAMHRVREMMPGIGELTSVAIEPGSQAVGKTLAELNLRAECGATVVALIRGDLRLEFPDGHERLAEGDLLALTGSEGAIGEAERLLGPEHDQDHHHSHA